MPSGPNGVILRRIDQIFRGQAVAGLAEGQLLERYLAHRDEAAFEALVDRHGPMVLGVCRRLLRDEHAVEDAFQAVFLVLVRRAGQIRERHLIGPWLHAVATRTAVRARANCLKRRAVEGAETPFDPADRDADPAARDDLGELRTVLDEEVGRLPEKYRRPVVLCYFEGKTHDEAAALLHWPVGTVRGRLSRARDRLRTRLTRRGLALGAGLTASHVFQQSAPAALPPALVAATVRGALAFAVGEAGAGMLSTSASALGEDILRTMLMTKWKFLSATALTALGLAATGAAVNAVQQPGPGPSPTPGAAAPILADNPPPPTLTNVAQSDAVPATPEPPPVDTAPPPPADHAADAVGPVTTLPPPAEASPGPGLQNPPDARPDSVPASLPPPPPGQNYRRVTITGEDGTPLVAYILAPASGQPAPQPQPDLPSIPGASEPLPSPMPVSVPYDGPSPSESPLPGVPEPDVPPDIRSYLERTKGEVGQAIERLTHEESELTTRLRGISEDLRRLKEVQKALEQQFDGEATASDDENPPPAEMEDAPLTQGEAGAIPPSEPPGLSDGEIPPPRFEPDGPAEAIQPTGMIVPADSPQEQRLREVESKLDRLLEAIEGLKGEIQAIKGGDTPPVHPS